MDELSFPLGQMKQKNTYLLDVFNETREILLLGG